MTDRRANQELETSSDQWIIRSFYELASITSGQVDPKKAPYRDMVLVAPDHIRSGTGRLDTRQTAIEQGAISGKYFVKPTEIIYSKIRPNLRKIAFADEVCLCSADMYPIRAKPGISPKFLMYLILSKPFTEFSTAASARSGLPKINRDELRFYEAKVPVDETEQHAIAEALSDADGVVEGLERLIEKKRHIKQGAMQDLLTAKRRLPGFSGEWVERKLGEIGYVKTGLTYSPDNVAKYGTLVLRSSNIQNERLAFENNVLVNVTVSEEATVRDGDLLICVRNGSRRLIGKTARIDARADGMAFGAFMSAFRSDLNDFLIWCFQSNVVQRQIEENLGATINQITNKTLKSLKVQLPLDDDERDEICRALRDMDAEISALETRLQKACAIKECMMQNLLTGRIRLV